MTKRNLRAIDNALTRLPLVESHRKAIELQTIGDHSQPLRPSPYPRFATSHRTSTTPCHAPPTEAQTNSIPFSSPNDSPITSIDPPIEVQMNHTTTGSIALSSPQVLSDNLTTPSAALPTEIQMDQTITSPTLTPPQLLNDGPITPTAPSTEAQMNQITAGPISLSPPQVLNNNPATSSTTLSTEVRMNQTTTGPIIPTAPSTEVQTNQTTAGPIALTPPQVLNDSPVVSTVPSTEVQTNQAPVGPIVLRLGLVTSRSSYTGSVFEVISGRIRIESVVM